MKKIISNLVLLIFSLTFIFFCLNLTLSFLGYHGAVYQYDEETGLGVLIPNNSFIHQKSCFSNKVQTNQDGFHDRNFSIQKEENTFRIAVIGDSFVQSLEVPLEKTFHKKLEKRLNQNNDKRNYEVYSFGRSGNGSSLNYLFLKNFVKKYQPDLVLHSFFPLNDLRDDSIELTQTYIQETGDQEVVLGKVYPDPHSELTASWIESELQKQKEKRGEKSFFEKFFRKLAVVGWFKEKIKIFKYKLNQTESDQPLSSDSLPIDFQVFLKDQTEAYSKAWEIQKNLIHLIKNESEEIGARYVLFSLADSLRVNEQYKNLESWNDQKMNLNQVEERLKQISEELGVTYYPLYPYFKENLPAQGNEIAFPCDGHWNELGHDLAARGLYEFFMSNKTLIQ